MKKSFRMALLSYKSMFSYIDPKLYLLMMIVNPILQMVFFTYLMKFAYHTQDIGPWVIANAYILGINSAIFMVGTSIRNERNAGTLEYVVASPANSLLVFVTRGFLQLLDIMMKIVLGIFMAHLLFGFKITMIDMWRLAEVLLAGVTSGLAFGMLLGSICLLMRDDLVLLNSAEQTLMIMTGAFFPIALLPMAFQKISGILPLTHGIKAASLLLVSGGTSEFHRLIAMEFTVAMIYILMGYILYGICIRMARRHATLDLT